MGLFLLPFQLKSLAASNKSENIFLVFRPVQKVFSLVYSWWLWWLPAGLVTEHLLWVEEGDSASHLGLELGRSCILGSAPEDKPVKSPLSSLSG